MVPQSLGDGHRQKLGLRYHLLTVMSGPFFDQVVWQAHAKPTHGHVTRVEKDGPHLGPKS